MKFIMHDNKIILTMFLLTNVNAFAITPDWKNDMIYNQGDRVNYKSYIYEALWWTKGNEPSSVCAGNGGPWKAITKPQGIPEWNSQCVYNSNDLVTYYSKTYRALYWTKGNTPNLGGAWELKENSSNPPVYKKGSLIVKVIGDALPSGQSLILNLGTNGIFNNIVLGSQTINNLPVGKYENITVNPLIIQNSTYSGTISVDSFTISENALASITVTVIKEKENEIDGDSHAYYLKTQGTKVHNFKIKTENNNSCLSTQGNNLIFIACKENDSSQFFSYDLSTKTLLSPKTYDRIGKVEIDYIKKNIEAIDSKKCLEKLDNNTAIWQMCSDTIGQKLITEAYINDYGKIKKDQIRFVKLEGRGNWEKHKVFLRTYMAQGRFQPTGVYLKPNTNIKIFLLDNLTIQVGVGSYNLGEPKFYSLNNGENNISNSSGGLLYIDENTYNKKDPIILVFGGLMAPYFQLGRSYLSDWQQTLQNLKQNIIPYTELVSNRAMVTVKTNEATKNNDLIYNPSDLLKNYDKIINSHDQLAGIAQEDPSFKLRPRFQAVQDPTTSGAYYYATDFRTFYPTNAVRMILDKNGVTSWGPYHEFGHQYEMGILDWGGLVEVVNNIFSMRAQVAFGQQSRLEADNEYKVINNYVTNEALYNKNFDNLSYFEKLTMFWQLRLAYGDAFYQCLFKQYRHMDKNIFTEAQEKRDLFAYISSSIVNQNLTPFFDKWGLKLSPQAKLLIQNQFKNNLASQIWLNTDSKNYYKPGSAVNKQCQTIQAESVYPILNSYAVYESKIYSSNDTSHYFVTDNPSVGPTEGVWDLAENNPTKIKLILSDDMNSSRKIALNLNGFKNGCYKLSMNSGVQCTLPSLERLLIEYNKLENTGILTLTGSYSGTLTIFAKSFHNNYVNEKISLKLKLTIRDGNALVKMQP